MRRRHRRHTRSRESKGRGRGFLYHEMQDAKEKMMAKLATSRWLASSIIPRQSWFAVEVSDVADAGVDLGTETNVFRVRTMRKTKRERKKVKRERGGVHDGRGCCFLPAAMATLRG